MLRFVPGAEWFAVAGCVAACAPFIIHLLNRRRYRVVAWAAMDFLRQALQRNRKILQLRDLLLLVLRTACVLLFGLAMARPYFASGDAAANANLPVHAVLLLDNSLSMGFERLEGTLLQQAKSEARLFIDRLPRGSRVTVLPLCGAADGFSREAYRSGEDALEAVDRITLVDRATSVVEAAEKAAEACQGVPELPAKRVLVFGDQQARNWTNEELAGRYPNLPEMQFVQVSARDAENSWIADFRLQDDLADVETPAEFLVTIRHQGAGPRSNVPVTLRIGDVEVAQQTIDLEPGQTREVRFSHLFQVAVEPGQVELQPATVSLAADSLPLDDSRYLAVPVVAALPVLFIDQYGTRESAAQNRLGETLPLRRLLVPLTSTAEGARPLIQVRHLAIDELDRADLEDVRLCVVAGIEDPGTSVPLLQEFVFQGGQLFVAAGGGFDPAKWTRAAWQDGLSLLPLPLRDEPVGRLPEEAVRTLEPFFLDPESMVADEFYLDQSSKEELSDLYRQPLFFKLVAAEETPALRDQLRETELKRWTEWREQISAVESERTRLQDRKTRGLITAEEEQTLNQLETRRTELQPVWLRWATTGEGELASLSAEELARRSEPRVLARFSNQLPYLVEKRFGRGRVLLVTSGLQSSWNNLPRTNTILIFDRLMRTRLAETLPRRSFETTTNVVLPVAAIDRQAELVVERPDGRQESLTVDALGHDLYGATVPGVTRRGIYTVTARARQGASGNRDPEKLWEAVLAVNGPESESDLKTVTEDEVAKRLGALPYRWWQAGDEVRVEGASVAGVDLWKWLMGMVLLALLLELAVIAWPQWQMQRMSGAGLTREPAA